MTTVRGGNAIGSPVWGFLSHSLVLLANGKLSKAADQNIFTTAPETA